MLLTLLVLSLGQVKLQQAGVPLGSGYVDTINCTGDGVTCSVSARKGTLEIAGGSGGGGLPDGGGVGANIAVITYQADSSLTSERVLSAGNYTVIDNATTAQSQVDWAHGLTCSAGQALTSSGTTAMACTSTLTASDVVCSGTCIADAEIAAVATTKLTGTVTNAQLASSYSGVGTCTNQFARVLNANAAPTCATVALAADVSGTLPEARGGTGAGALTCTATEGLTSNGTAYSCRAIAADISSASFITKVAESGLSNELALGSLATGVIVNTTTTGVPTIKGANTCTNQFARSDNASGAWTCASVSLTADVTGTLPAAQGGLGAAQPTCGFGTFLQCNGTTCSCVAQPKVVTSNITNSTTTPANITGLSWAVAANTEYGFHCVINSSGTATGGSRFNLNGPAAATTVSFTTERYTTTALQTLLVLQAFSAAAQTAACTSACTTTVLPTIISGTILNGANAGTAQLMVTSSTAAQAVVVYRGSFCVVY